MNGILSKECQVLLQLLAKDLFNTAEPIEWETVSLKALYEEAKNQTVIAIAFNALPPEAAKSDSEAYAYWQGMSYKIMQQSLNNNLANAKLTEFLESNNIEHCTIKGYASAYYYPNPTLRQMGDIDFIIIENEKDKVTDLLVNTGFDKKDSDHGFHIGLKKDKMTYEMHVNVTELPEDKKYLFKYLDNIIPASHKVSTNFGDIRIPDALHHAIVMLLHMHRHLVDGFGIGIRHLCDWAVLVDRFENEEWEENFESVLKAMGLWQFAKAMSKACAYYLKMPSKKWFESVDDEIVKNLMYNILQGGNFGRKDSAQMTQQKIFSDQKHNDKNIIVRFFYGVNIHIYGLYPLFKKYKILLPIGYLIYSLRILTHILFKNKKLNLLDVYKKGNEQFNTYTRLKFFEEEK